MTDLNKLLEIDPEDMASSLLPQDTDLETISALKELVIQKLGPEAGEDFIQLVTLGTIPKEKYKFIEFFRGRKDLISGICLRTLNNGK